MHLISIRMRILQSSLRLNSTALSNYYLIFYIFRCTILGFSLSSQFNILIPMDLGMFIESHEQYAYTLCYLNALQIFRQPLILLELFHNELFWYATTNIDWLFYTCNLYLGLILKVNLSLAPTIHSFLVNECLTASLSLGCALHLFNAETHFAWFKPIH